MGLRHLIAAAAPFVAVLALPAFSAAAGIVGIGSPGSTDYPNAGLASLEQLDLSGEGRFVAGATDLANGHAYYATGYSPGKIIKYSFADDSAAPVKLGEFSLDPSEGSFAALALDTVNGYGYATTATVNPRRIVKFRLGAGGSAPSVVDKFESPFPLAPFGPLAIDGAGGFGYAVVNDSSTRILKLNLGAGDDPVTVHATQTNAGVTGLSCVLLDAASGHLWYGRNTSPGGIVKATVGAGADPPTVLNGIIFPDGDNLVVSAVADFANRRALLGTNTNPGRIIQVQLGAGDAVPVHDGTRTLTETTEQGMFTGAPGGSNYVLFGSNNSPARVVKMQYAAAGSPPSRIASLTLNSGEGTLRGMAPAGGATTRVLVAVSEDDGPILKVASNIGNTAPSRLSAAAPSVLTGRHPAVVLIDGQRQLAYLGCRLSATFARVLKVNISPAAPLAVVETLDFPAGERFITSGIINEARTHAWFAVDGTPAKLVKVKLGTGVVAMERLGSFSFDAGEEATLAILYNPGDNTALVSFDTTPGSVVKVNLGAGDALPTRVGRADFNMGEGPSRAGVIRPGEGQALFGTTDSPAKVVKVSLGSAAQAPARSSVLTLSTGENDITSAVMDGNNEFALFGVNTTPAHIVKVAPIGGAAAPARRSSMALGPGDAFAAWGLPLPEGDRVLFLHDPAAHPAGLNKINVNAGVSAPTLAGTVDLDGTRYFSQRVAAVDSGGGYAYSANLFGTPGLVPSSLNRHVFSPKGQVHGTKVIIAEQVEAQSVHIYSHAADGHFFASLYKVVGNSYVRQWRSAQINNTTTGFISQAVSAGSPSALVLDPGEYYLCVQTSSTADVLGYHSGPAESGIRFTYDTRIPAVTVNESLVTVTNANWAAYLLVEPTGVEEWRIY